MAGRRENAAGDPLLVFVSRTELLPNGCIIWTAGASKAGYGMFHANGGTVFAHRWSYEQFVGPIPAGMALDHRCHTDDWECSPGVCVHRLCVNPDHLEPVTIYENTRRMLARQRRAS